MTRPITPGDRPSHRSTRVDARRLWSGGAATAVVAGLVALVGVLAARWLFNVPVLAPRREGAYGDAHTTAVVLEAAAAALVATALMHLLLISTPRPVTFFGWIVGLVTVVVAIFPFSTSAPVTAKIVTAIVTLVVGIAIGSLITSVAARSVWRADSQRGYPDSRPYDRAQPDTEL